VYQHGIFSQSGLPDKFQALEERTGNGNGFLPKGEQAASGSLPCL
jgi:hypothetical protein